jgi:hypothetical protein
MQGDIYDSVVSSSGLLSLLFCERRSPGFRFKEKGFVVELIVREIGKICCDELELNNWKWFISLDSFSEGVVTQGG